MGDGKCRVCGHAFFEAPLLLYQNMPKAAQFFPDKAAVGGERGVDLVVFQCSGCGLVQLGNDPVPYHREVVRAAAVSEEMREFRLRQFAGFLERFSLKGKKVIEIGCGRGEFLSLLAEAGADAYGLEYSKASVEQCVRNGLKVSPGYLEGGEDRLEGAPFDAFVMLMFLEHLPNPPATLSGVSANLEEGAVGLVEVPNFEMILRENLFSEFIGDHLFYFTEDTLRSTLNLCGFEVVECTALRYEYVLSAVVKKRRKLDVSRFHGHEERIAGDLSGFISRFGEGKVAVWGAGHQALAAISMTGVGPRIKYVVDSAPFKQGRFTPATHIPVVSPEALEADPVDAVIVMAASYSDEVAGIIRRRFGHSMRVAILRSFGLEEADGAGERE